MRHSDFNRKLLRIPAISKALCVLLLCIGVSACVSHEESVTENAKQGHLRQDNSIPASSAFSNADSSRGAKTPNNTAPDQLYDPWQSLNRRTLSLNLWMDTWLPNPASKAYYAVTPEFVRTGVRNFSGNFGELGNALNSLLQLEINNMGRSLARFGVNSTVGVLGLFDPASHLEITSRKEDFGQTFAVWGLPSGPYIVLPFLGPSTVRGAAGFATNLTVNLVDKLPVENLEAAKYITTGLSVLDVRRREASSFEMLSASVDPYTLLKFFWWANRLNEINNGKSLQRTEGQDNNEDFDDFDDFDDLERAEEN